MKNLFKLFGALSALGLVISLNGPACALDGDLAAAQRLMRKGIKTWRESMNSRRDLSPLKTARLTGERVWADSSWNEIEQTYRTEFPRFAFGTMFFSIRALCHVDGRYFEPTGPKTTVSACTDWEYYGDGDRRCIDTKEVRVRIPRVYQAEECLPADNDHEPSCMRTRPVTRTRKLSHDIYVYPPPHDDPHYPASDHLFIKRYDIPACRI